MFSSESWIKRQRLKKPKSSCRFIQVAAKANGNWSWLIVAEGHKPSGSCLQPGGLRRTAKFNKQSLRLGPFNTESLVTRRVSEGNHQKNLTSSLTET